MLGTYFYHGLFEKYIIAFGNLFNNIYIRRLDAANDIVQQMKVPLIYAPKEKYLAVIDQNTGGVEVKLPRMAFEITSPAYDPERKRVTTNRITRPSSIGTTASYTYDSVPYDLSLSLTVYARNSGDGFQIIEQILPYFTPKISVAVNVLPQIGLVYDVPYTLVGIGPLEEYEHGQDPAHKTFMWTLDFSSKVNFYGPVLTTDTLITTVITQQYANLTSLADNVTATYLTNAASRITITPDPANATANASWTYNTEFLGNE